jgi:peptidoglycan hydrolase-like protein with peptidoglycan-binding domain
VSRSHWAWWPSGASSAALRLTRRCCIVAAMVAVWALGPASSLAQAADRSPSTTATSTIKKPATADPHHHSVKRAVRHHTPPGQTSGAGLLGPGAGYASRDGSRLVRQLQRQLTLAGDHPGPLDGRFGPLTEAAVIRFQTAHGLPVDGIVGPLTAGALRAGRRALTPGAGYHTVSGSSAVRVLQRRLARRGFDPGPIDGRYGPLTMRAVAHFQQAHHLMMTGIAGVHTRAVLIGLTQQRHPKIGSTQQRHPKISTVVARVPSPKRQQLPLTPATGPTDTLLTLLTSPIMLVLLGVPVLGLLAIAVTCFTIRYRIRRRVGKPADTGSDAPSRPPAGVHTGAGLIGSTQQRHPTSSPASAPVGLQPSRERQQLPQQPSRERQQLRQQPPQQQLQQQLQPPQQPPQQQLQPRQQPPQQPPQQQLQPRQQPPRERQQLALTPADGPPDTLPALPITPVLLSVTGLGLLALTVSYSRTRRHVGKPAGTGSRARSRPPRSKPRRGSRSQIRSAVVMTRRQANMRRQ